MHGSFGVHGVSCERAAPTWPPWLTKVGGVVVTQADWELLVSMLLPPVTRQPATPVLLSSVSWKLASMLKWEAVVATNVRSSVSEKGAFKKAEPGNGGTKSGQACGPASARTSVSAPTTLLGSP